MGDSLGELLASARRSAGKTIADVEAGTRIRGRMIDALEKDDREALPARAYVRGYIISYAKFLDIDPEPLLKRFAEENADPREQLRLPEQVVPRRHETHAVPYRTAVVIVAAVLLVAIAVWGIGRLTGGGDDTAPLPTVPEATSTIEATSTEQSTPVVEPEATETETEPIETVAGESFVLAVEIAGDGASWLRVTVDGLIAYEGTLSGGETKEWEVTESATLRIGKPTAVTVTRDGEVVEIPLNANTPEMTLSVSDAQ